MFDPLLPANNSPNSSAQMRGQLTSLKALIDAFVGITGAQVDSVTTLPPGNSATMSVSIINNELHFIVGIPQGNDGAMGIPGNDGAMGIQGIQGADGAQGLPGEVTAAQLATAISGTSNNSNAVATLDTPFADPDAESMRLRFNDLVTALRRV